MGFHLLRRSIGNAYTFITSIIFLLHLQVVHSLYYASCLRSTEISKKCSLKIDQYCLIFLKADKATLETAVLDLIIIVLFTEFSFCIVKRYGSIDIFKKQPNNF